MKPATKTVPKKKEKLGLVIKLKAVGRGPEGEAAAESLESLLAPP